MPLFPASKQGHCSNLAEVGCDSEAFHAFFPYRVQSSKMCVIWNDVLPRPLQFIEVLNIPVTGSSPFFSLKRRSFHRLFSLAWKTLCLPVSLLHNPTDHSRSCLQHYTVMARSPAESAVVVVYLLGLCGN